MKTWQKRLYCRHAEDFRDIGVKLGFFQPTIKDYEASFLYFCPFYSKVAGGCVPAFNRIFIFFNITPVKRQRGAGGLRLGLVSPCDIFNTPAHVGEKNPSQHTELPGDIISIIGHWTRPPSHVKKKLTNWSDAKAEWAKLMRGVGWEQRRKHQSSLAAAAVGKCSSEDGEATVALKLTGHLTARMTGRCGAPRRLQFGLVHRWRRAPLVLLSTSACETAH